MDTPSRGDHSCLKVFSSLLKSGILERICSQREQILSFKCYPYENDRCTKEAEVISLFEKGGKKN